MHPSLNINEKKILGTFRKTNLYYFTFFALLNIFKKKRKQTITYSGYVLHTLLIDTINNILQIIMYNYTH